LAGLPPLNDPKHPDPGLCPRDLTGERRGSGVSPRHGWGFRPVHLDHVAGEGVFVAFVARFHGLIDRRAFGPQRTIASFEGEATADGPSAAPVRLEAQ